MATHSEKALATMALMLTAATDWFLAPIKWVEEMRLVPTWVTCPTCDGSKHCCVDADGKAIPRPKVPRDPHHVRWYASTPEDKAAAEAMTDEEYRALRVAFDAARDARDAYDHAARRRLPGVRYDGCVTCRTPSRRWGWLSQGTVLGMRNRLVMVGYVQWPKGTQFDSRYQGGMHCGLCNKLITKSWMVPVCTDGKTPHGMWVGSDCAQKFLAVKAKAPKSDATDSDDAILVPADDTKGA